MTYLSTEMNTGCYFIFGLMKLAGHGVKSKRVNNWNAPGIRVILSLVGSG